MGVGKKMIELAETLDEWLEKEIDSHLAQAEIFKRILRKMKGGKK